MIDFPANLKKQRPKARSFPETPNHLITKGKGTPSSIPTSDQPHDDNGADGDNDDSDNDFYGALPMQRTCLEAPAHRDRGGTGALRFALDMRIDCRKVPASDGEPLGGIQCLLRVHDRVWCGHAKGHISIWDARVLEPPFTPLHHTHTHIAVALLCILGTDFNLARG
jgi:hypothetical protein